MAVAAPNRLPPAALNAPRRPFKVIAGGVTGKRSPVVRAAVILAATAAAAAFIFGLVLVNIFIAQNSFRLAELQTQVAREQDVYRKLRFEVAQAESPGRLDQAVSELGLVVPQSQIRLPSPWNPDPQPAAGVEDEPPPLKALLSELTPAP